MWLETLLGIKDLAKAVKDFKKEERESLGELFMITSELLESIAISFHEDSYPVVACATLESLSHSVSENIGKIAKRNKIDDVVDAYMPFYSMEEEWAKRKDEKSITRLLEIAGEFKALGILFKI